MPAVIAGMTQTIEAMRLAFNNNHAAYAQAIGAIDGHITVFRQVLNDVQRDDVRLVDGNIDWDYYYGCYNAHLEETRREEEKARAAVSDTDTATREEIFGGDYNGSSGL